MRAPLMVALIGAVGWLSGCGENCQNTCQRVYDPSECGVVLPGIEAKELIKDCASQCEFALQRTGEARFDPLTTPASDDSWKLENESEAAAWIDCVWQLAPGEGPSKECGNIDPQQGGFCAPI